MNTKICVEKQEEIKGFQRKIIKIYLEFQEIKNEIANIKIEQHNDNGKFEEVILQQSEDTRVIEKSHNKLEHNLIHRIR